MKLEQLNTFFDERSHVQLADFWNDALLGTHSDWKTVRQKADEILSLMGMHEWTIALERQVMTDNQVIVEYTSLNLVKKK